MTFLKIAATLIAAAALSATAHASVLFSHDFGNHDQATGNSIAATFSGDGEAADLAFHLDGFKGLDGDDAAVDVFTLSVNGTDIFSGTFDLGGGGGTLILLNSHGATYTGGSFGSLAGGALDFEVPIELRSGLNTVKFSYASPTTFQGHAATGPQGLADEGWGLGQVTVSTVPEPAGGALLLAGLGVTGGVLRRRSACRQA